MDKASSVVFLFIHAYIPDKVYKSARRVTVHRHAFDVRSRAAVSAVFSEHKIDAVVHLAGIMSAQSEANLELGCVHARTGSASLYEP